MTNSLCPIIHVHLFKFNCRHFLLNLAHISIIYILNVLFSISISERNYFLYYYFLFTWARGERASRVTEAAPASSPKRVTRSGFPPNWPIWALIHLSTSSWSSSPWLPVGAQQQTATSLPLKGQSNEIFEIFINLIRLGH